MNVAESIAKRKKADLKEWSATQEHFCDEWLARTDTKPRHLARLYSDRPAWFDLAHKKLDAAVFAAYGWSPEMTAPEILQSLLELNLERAGR